MVGKLRHFADKMILIKRHQSASLDKKSADILPKTKQKKTMKGHRAKGRTPSARQNGSEWFTLKIEAESRKRQHKNRMCWK